MTGRVYLGFDGSASDDNVVMFDGQTYRFIGYIDDDGLVVGDVPETFYLNAAGERVEVGEVTPAGIRMAVPRRMVTFTMPLRDAEKAPPAIRHVRPRCPKCSSPLAPCDVCGGPALCGEAWCERDTPA